MTTSDRRATATENSPGRDRRAGCHRSRMPQAEQLTVNPDDPMSSSLLRKATASEPKAWHRLMSLYSPLVAHWCRQAGLNRNDRQDVMQEVFSAVAASLPSFRADRDGVTYRSWLRRIAHHKIQDHFRHRPDPAPGGTDAHRRLQDYPNQSPRSNSPRATTRSPSSISGPWSWSGPSSKSGPGRPSGKSRSRTARPPRSPHRWGSPSTPSARPSRGSCAAQGGDGRAHLLRARFREPASLAADPGRAGCHRPRLAKAASPGRPRTTGSIPSFDFPDALVRERSPARPTQVIDRDQRLEHPSATVWALSVREHPPGIRDGYDGQAVRLRSCRSRIRGGRCTMT